MKSTLVMKKIGAPIMYSLFFIPAFCGGILIAANVEDLFQYLGFRDMGMVTIFSCVCIAMLYLGNIVLQKTEKISAPSFADHFRQSSLYYVGFVVAVVEYARLIRQYPYSECRVDCFGYGVSAAFILVPLFAIIINGLYLWRINK